MHLIEKWIVNNSTSVFMHISCVADNLQFKDTDRFGKKSLDLVPCVQITFRKPAAGVGQGREEEGRNRGLWGEGGPGQRRTGRAVGRLLCRPCPRLDRPLPLGQEGDGLVRSLPPGSRRRRSLGVGFGSEPVREHRRSPTGVGRALGREGGGWQLEKPG